ncbi:MAG: sulfatase [Verrucomicrobiae bacterium]|nr:sulfatase [Verrucomicrobiae bacterium]NNJ42925.1 sulfatase [Akkermansiaceae bacterium]
MNNNLIKKTCHAIGMSIVLQASLLPMPIQAAQATPPLNVLLITADDLNYNSIGSYGCSIPNITPNLDRLAKGGLKFNHAHVNIAICQPCRQSIMTGRYPHTNGAEGFDPIDAAVPTLQEHLRTAGYLNGILGKEQHLKPIHRYCWDLCITEGELASGAGIGRSPERYHQYSKAFLKLAKDQKKPFFLMANIHDPHRPFAGSAQELHSWANDLPKVTRRIKAEDVNVPGFLANIPNVRKEIAEYYTSVYRCDESVGAILKALDESGFANNTLVMFLSDNGIAVPFAKANCYLNSTKTPWIVSWPGKTKAGSVDDTHLISGIDFMPTILEALDINQVDGIDGRSFLPLLRNEKQAGRDYAFTEFHKTYARRCFPMRAIQGKKLGYIVNFWANRTAPMRMDSTSGLSFNAMQKAGKTNPEIASRVTLFDHRVLEEFFDFENDPDGLNNLIAHPEYQDKIKEMRHRLREEMKRTSDPALSTFEQLDNPAALDAFMKAQQARAKK